jgi:hypothetical protein
LDTQQLGAFTYRIDAGFKRLMDKVDPDFSQGVE